MDRTYDAVSITLIGESMEGNWLYKLLLANGWSEATAEGLSIAVNVALAAVRASSAGNINAPSATPSRSA